MADYYSLLAKAVGNLPKTSPPTARKAIYDRARAALIRQLRSLGPTLSEADIAREEAALETAVARLEEQYEAPEPPAASSAAPPPPPPASPPRPAENAVRPPISTASRPAANFPPKPPTFGPPAPPPLRPTLQPGQNPSASNILPPLRPPAPRPPGAPEATLRSPAAAPPLARPLPAQRSAPAPTPPAPPSLPPTPAAPPQTPTAPPPTPVAQRVPPAGDTSAAPPVFASSGLMYEFEAEAPLIEPGIDADRGPRNGASDGDLLRPSAPTRFEAPSANPLPWVLLAVVVGLVLSIAVAAFLLRQKPQDLAIKEPAPVSDAQPEANAPKIAERVGGGDTPAPTPTPTQSAQAAPSPTPDAAASPAPAASPAATPSAAATPNAAPTAAASANSGPDSRDPARRDAGAAGRSACGHADRSRRGSAEAAGREPRFGRLDADSGGAGPARQRRGQGRDGHPRSQDARDHDDPQKHGCELACFAYDRSPGDVRGQRRNQRRQGYPRAADAQGRSAVARIRFRAYGSRSATATSWSGSTATTSTSPTTSI